MVIREPSKDIRNVPEVELYAFMMQVETWMEDTQLNESDGE